MSIVLQEIGREAISFTVVRSKRARSCKWCREVQVVTTFDEPVTTYDAKYPKNHVFESESGHIVEYDDTW